MAPARMVSFMEQHISSCPVCRQDPDLKDEVAKITEMVLPESKIPKAIRQQEEIDPEIDEPVEDEEGSDLDEEVEDEVDEVDEGIDDELVEDDDPTLDDEL